MVEIMAQNGVSGSHLDTAQVRPSTCRAGIVQGSTCHSHSTFALNSHTLDSSTYRQHTAHIYRQHTAHIYRQHTAHIEYLQYIYNLSKMYIYISDEHLYDRIQYLYWTIPSLLLTRPYLYIYIYILYYSKQRPIN